MNSNITQVAGKPEAKSNASEKYILVLQNKKQLKAKYLMQQQKKQKNRSANKNEIYFTFKILPIYGLLLSKKRKEKKIEKRKIIIMEIAYGSARLAIISLSNGNIRSHIHMCMCVQWQL